MMASHVAMGAMGLAAFQVGEKGIHGESIEDIGFLTCFTFFTKMVYGLFFNLI